MTTETKSRDNEPWKIVREYAGPSIIHPATYRVSVRMGHYGHTLQLILGLLAALREDYPDVADSEIEIAHYGGPRIAQHWGLEFTVETEPGDRFTKTELEPLR